jgi:hypothetical protein
MNDYSEYALSTKKLITTGIGFYILVHFQTIHTGSSIGPNAKHVFTKKETDMFPFMVAIKRLKLHKNGAYLLC